jgi:hypothetical protein
MRCGQQRVAKRGANAGASQLGTISWLATTLPLSASPLLLYEM